MTRSEEIARAEAILEKDLKDWTPADDVFLLRYAGYGVRRERVRDDLTILHAGQSGVGPAFGRVELLQIRSLLRTNYRPPGRRFTLRGFWIGLRARFVGQDATIGVGVDEIEEAKQ